MRLAASSDAIHSEVALGHQRRSDVHRLVGQSHVQRGAVGVAVYRHRADAHLAQRADDPDGDLASVCYQDLAKHGQGSITAGLDVGEAIRGPRAGTGTATDAEIWVGAGGSSAIRDSGIMGGSRSSRMQHPRERGIRRQRCAGRAAGRGARGVVGGGARSRLKHMLESNTRGVWVRGEVSGLHRAASRHVYFSLKDEHEDAVIECVMYRTAPPRARNALCGRGERGARRAGHGLSAARPHAASCDDLLQTARGALLEALERLKSKLADEGLFDQERKRPLPAAPGTVAVLTSPDGAAIHDVIRVAFSPGPGADPVGADPRARPSGGPERSPRRSRWPTAFRGSTRFW